MIETTRSMEGKRVWKLTDRFGILLNETPQQIVELEEKAIYSTKYICKVQVDSSATNEFIFDNLVNWEEIRVGDHIVDLKNQEVNDSSYTIDTEDKKMSFTLNGVSLVHLGDENWEVVNPENKDSAYCDSVSEQFTAVISAMHHDENTESYVDLDEGLLEWHLRRLETYMPTPQELSETLGGKPQKYYKIQQNYDMYRDAWRWRQVHRLMNEIERVKTN